MQVALAKGKKLYDKRQTIKDKDINRELERDFKLKFKQFVLSQQAEFTYTSK